MNKLKKLIGLVLCALLLTGCELKYEGQVEITKDGKMDMSVIMAYDRELVSTLIYMDKNDDLLGNEDEDESNIPEATLAEIRKYLEDNKPEEEEGLEVSRYERNGFYGYQMSYEINNIDDVSSPDELDNSLFGDLNLDDEDDTSNKKEKQMFFQKIGDTYKAKYKINNSSSSTNGTDASLAMLNVSLKYTVTLPTKPENHNADSVSEDGKTLTWNIDALDSKKDSIEYSFKLKDTTAVAAKSDGLNTEMIMLIAGIVIIVIIIVVVLVLFAKNNKKLDKSLEALDQTIPSAPPKPSTPVAENNVAVTPNSQVTPVVPTVPTSQETSTQVKEAPQYEQVTNEVNMNSKIEAVPVVENIPVQNIATNEQQNTLSTEQSEQVQENVISQPTSVVNLDEMPIIMEPAVTAPVETTQVQIENSNATENVTPVETPVNSNVEQSNNVIEVAPVVNNIEEKIVKPQIENIQSQPINEPIIEPKLTETSQEMTPNIENTPVEVTPQVESQQESNIFDTPNIYDEPVTETKVETIEPLVENTTETTPIIENTPVVEEQLQTINLVTETPSAENQTANIPTDNNVQVTEIQVEPTISEPQINNVELETQVMSEPVIEPQIDNTNVIEQVETNQTEVIETPKIEVLENIDTTLREPDIPLPEPEINEPIIENTTLEEAPKMEEPTGNKFIQTDFMDNKPLESNEEDENI